ncbi:MAG TPA: excinuclease ABC subunit UvrC [Gemmatimonadales bacterium]
MTSPAPPELARKLDTLPEAPGVYLWKDGAGRVVYIGKANRLRSRVRSYFATDATHSPKLRMLRRAIADVDTIVVRSESEALLLENNLIKEYAPRFNILLRDDKSYPSIAVTLGEPFPRVLVVRREQIPGARMFGPYTDVGTLRRTLRIVRRIFTVRSCHYALPDDAPERACLDYHIGRCLAPCVGRQTVAAYRAMMDDVVAFLEGRTVEVRGRLRARMEAASAALDFERAAELRNALRWLEQLEQPAAVERVGGGDADALGLARDGDDAAVTVLRVRGGKLLAHDTRFLHNLAEEPDDRVLAAYLVQWYRLFPGGARQVLMPFPPAEHDEIAALFPGVRWLVPQRGTLRRLVDLADQNARHALEGFRIEALETDERADDPVYALGRDLGLTVVPRSLVCIDISTNQGRDTVGSLVWFEAGRPRKGEYRKFKIRGTPIGDAAAPAAEGGRVADAGGAAGSMPDDYAAIREVVTRYMQRRVNESRPIPDLMVIDGGKGQLGAAQEALAHLGVTGIQLASLAKRDEEVFLPDQAASIRLSRRSPSLRLLQRARDEAHRFALTYSRARRTARTVTSELLTVPGVGPVRRRALLARFGSLAGVRLASADEIATVPGFSKVLAERILQHLGDA